MGTPHMVALPLRSPKTLESAVNSCSDSYEPPSSLARLTAGASHRTSCFCPCPSPRPWPLASFLSTPLLTHQPQSDGLDPSTHLSLSPCVTPTLCSQEPGSCSSCSNFQMVTSSEKQQRRPLCSCSIFSVSPLSHQACILCAHASWS